MNIGKYLRGEDRHVGTARTTYPLSKGVDSRNCPHPIDKPTPSVVHYLCTMGKKNELPTRNML